MSNMWSLKHFTAALLLSCWLSCSLAKEQPQVQIITEHDLHDSIEPRSRFLDGLHREAKRQKAKSPNVHIENIYIPQQIQKGDETVQDQPLYPVYTYPISSHPNLEETESTKQPLKSQKQTKPKPSELQPTLIYGQQLPEQNNAFISLPYPEVLAHHSLINSEQSPQAYPYFVIVNSPHAIRPYQRKPTKTITTPHPEVQEQNDEFDNEDEDSEIEDIVSKLKKRPYKVQSRKPRPQLKLSQNEGNIGLAIAKYLLAHPLYSANDMERSSQHASAEEEGDEKDAIAEEDTEGKYSGNTDMLTAEGNDDDDELKKIEDSFTQHSTRGNKLPADLYIASTRPTKKIDDRVALVYLRHTKRGRQLLMAQE